MKRRLWTALLAVALGIGLTACGGVRGQDGSVPAPDAAVPATAASAGPGHPADADAGEPPAGEAAPGQAADAALQEASQSLPELPETVETESSGGEIIAGTGQDMPQAAPDGLTAVAVEVGDSRFTAKFYDNDSARALLSMMPLTLEMSDHNRNEKMIYLPQVLPATAAERPDSIGAGEIKLYDESCLVLFYDSFSNSYGGYTSLGYMEDVTGLADALGAGQVTVHFRLAKEE